MDFNSIKNNFNLFSCNKIFSRLFYKQLVVFLLQLKMTLTMKSKRLATYFGISALFGIIEFCFSTKISLFLQLYRHN